MISLFTFHLSQKPYKQIQLIIKRQLSPTFNILFKWKLFKWFENCYADQHTSSILKAQQMAVQVEINSSD